VTHAALTSKRLDGDRYEAFTSQVANGEVLLAEFRGTSNAGQEELFVSTLVGPEVQRARELRSVALDANDGARLDIDPDEWWQVTSYELDLLRRVEQRLGADALARAGVIESDAVRSSITEGLGILLVLLISVGLSLYVVRLLVKPLRLLRTSAESVAQVQLPGIVQRLQRAEPIDLDAETAPVQVHSRDEVGQVAWAFNSVHSVAVRVAAEQAALRAGVARLFLNLGQRIQGLVSGQLELLDELERSELDPEQLHSLFRLDHMATRMRRNAENLLVLSGADASRRWDEPVALAGMLRAATAEIEDYTRVSLMPMGEARVAGEAVNDVVHLLAELLENATRFSPAGTQVQVSGEAAPRGFMIEIEDQGVGMTDQELTEINERLADPPVVDLVAEHRLGVFVVGRLAARHGIRVRLRRSWFGGVTALVLLPNGLIIGAEPPTREVLDLARDLPALARPGRINGARHGDVAGRYGRAAIGGPVRGPVAPPVAGAWDAPARRGGLDEGTPAEPSWAEGAGRLGGARSLFGPTPTPESRPGDAPTPETPLVQPRPPWQGPRHAAMGSDSDETTTPIPQPPGGVLPRRIRGASARPGVPVNQPPEPAPTSFATHGEPIAPSPHRDTVARPAGAPLPRRVRGANLARGIAVGPPEGEPTSPFAGQRAASDVRRALSTFQSAVARGRNDAITQPRPPQGAGEDRGPVER
jgi:nitrate/nitrite sensing protein/histidine kinase/DNA gyrase B/HSP90-like ATPase